MSKHDPLPAPWVDRIFARMLVRYGVQWIRMWEGIDPEAVKADWAMVLAGANADAINHGLENLPLDKPPTSAQFAQACRRVPIEPPPMLPAPAVNRAHVQRVLDGLNLRINRGTVRPARYWALDLKEREERGEKLTQFQRDVWREAVRMHLLPEEAAA